MDKVPDRLKVLIDSSTPIVVMETVEETRAVRMVRAACSALNLAAFEWTIASGLVRSGSGALDSLVDKGSFVPGGYRAGTVDDVAESAKALYDSREPAKMLANLEGITIEAAFLGLSLDDATAKGELFRHLGYWSDGREVTQPLVGDDLTAIPRVFPTNGLRLIGRAPRVVSSRDTDATRR